MEKAFHGKTILLLCYTRCKRKTMRSYSNVYTSGGIGELYREICVATDKGDILYMIKGITVAELPR